MKRKLICALLVLCTLCSVPASGTWLCEAADGDWTTTLNAENVSPVEVSQATAGSDCELLTADPNTVECPDWGITLSAENVTPTGMTLVTTHSGGNSTGELMYESAYHVEVFICDHWEFAPIINDIYFSGETFQVVLEGSEREELNWEHGYGELPPGRYRIVRRFWDYRRDGDFDEAELYVELPHTCVSEDGDVRCDQCYGIPAHECLNEDGDLRCDFCDELVDTNINMLEDPAWGITLSAENVTPTGMTLVTTHSGGNFTGELMYESAYDVEVFVRDHWEYVPIINDISWSGETFQVVLEGSEREELNWEHGYGELPPGRYRIVRRFWDYRGDGDFDEAELYVELPHTCVSEDGDGRCDQCYGVPEHECWNGNGDLRCDFCDELVDTNINMLENPAWGITLSAENVTPTGMTLVTTHSGGNFTGELMYESAYELMVYKEDHWEYVPIINDITWSGETFRVVLEGSEQEKLNWEHGYGQLPSGFYCIGRRFWDYRGDGDYDEAELYTYFVIADASVEEHCCDSFNNDFICDWCYAVIPHSCYAPDGCDYCEFCYQYIPEEERMGFWAGLFYSAEDGNTLFQLKKPGQSEASGWCLSWKGNDGYSLYDILGDYQLEISKSGHVIRTENVTLSKSCDGVDYDLYPLGDVTGDFVSNISDVAKIYSYACETGAPTDAYNAKCSDVNGDGKINVGDVAKLYGYTRGNSRIYYSYCVEVPQQWETCFIRGWDDRGNTTYYPLTQAEDGSWYGMLESWYTDFAICNIHGQTTVDLKCPKADSRLTLVPMNYEASLCDAVITVEGD